MWFPFSLACDHSLSVPGPLLWDSFLNVNHYWNSNVYFDFKVKKKTVHKKHWFILWSNLSGLIEKPGLSRHWSEEVTWVAFFSILFCSNQQQCSRIYTLCVCVESVELNLWLKNVSKPCSLERSFPGIGARIIVLEALMKSFNIGVQKY